MDKNTGALNAILAKRIGRRVVADGTEKLRIRCVGYSQSSEHYGDAVLVSDTSLTLSIDGVADTTVGASGVLAFATYTNLGKLVDAINLSSNWEAEIVAGTRADAVNGSELLARSTSTFRMYEEVSLYADSSDAGVYKIGVLLEPNKAFEYIHGRVNAESFREHRVGLIRHKSLVNTSGGETTTITAYELGPDKAASLETLGVWTGADDTEKDSGAQEVPLFHAQYGNSILVEVTSTGWVDTGAYLEVNGIKE